MKGAKILENPVAAIEAARAAEPGVSIRGFDPEAMSTGRISAAHARRRALMVEPYFVSQFVRATEFLVSRRILNNVNRSRTAEMWRKDAITYHYGQTSPWPAIDRLLIPQGALIAAALALGIATEWVRFTSCAYLAIGEPLEGA